MKSTSESTRVPYQPPSETSSTVAKGAKAKRGGSSKTILTVLLSIAAIVLLALPYAHGLLAKKISEELVKASNEDNQFGKVEISKYDGGYASSRVVIKWTTTIDVAGLDAGEYLFVCNTKHKISGYQQNCKLENADYLAWVQQDLNGIDPFTTSLKGNVIGQFGSELVVTPFEFIGTDGEIFSVGAAHFTSELKSISRSAMRFEGQADGFKLKDGEENIVIEGITLDGDLESDGALAFGFGNVLIDRLIMTEPQEQMVMNKVSFVYDLPQTSDKLDMKYDLRADSVVFKDAEGAESYTLTNASYAVQTGGFDAKVVSELSQKYQVAVKEIDDGYLSEEEVMSTVIDEVFMQQIDQLLIAGVFLKFDISAELDDKPFEARMSVKLDQGFTQQDFNTPQTGPDVFLQKADLAIKLSLSELLLNDIDKSMGYPEGSMAANSTMMVKNGDNLELVVTSKGGVITLNKEETSLAELMGTAMGMAAGPTTGAGMEDLSPEEQQ